MNTAVKGYLFYLNFIVLVLAIPILIVSMAVNLYAGSVNLYLGGFAKYHISAATGISNPQLKDVALGMVDYFAGKVQSPQVEVDINGIKRPVYSQKELIHLEDVRKIIDIFKMLSVLSLVLFLVMGLYMYFKFGFSQLLKSLQVGAVVTVVSLSFVMLWALIDFNSIFYFFHILSFSNDLWLLDPATDYLIMMFPAGFFFDSAVLIVATIIAVAIIVWFAAYVMKRVLLPANK
jgi:integral membrane protein (TIGR01906 family)